MEFEYAIHLVTTRYMEGVTHSLAVLAQVIYLHGGIFSGRSVSVIVTEDINNDR